METTMVCWGHIGIMEKKMEAIGQVASMRVSPRAPRVWSSWCGDANCEDSYP